MKYSDLISYRFQFFDENPMDRSPGKPEFPECAGVVIYEIRLYLHNEKGEPIKIHGEESYITTVMQPFGENKDIIRDDGYKFLSWGWDGNREKPTLFPSFLYNRGSPNMLHLFVRRGKLEILHDTRMYTKDVVRKE